MGKQTSGRLKLPKSVNGIASIGFTVVKGRARVDEKTAKRVQGVVEAMRGYTNKDERFPLSWTKRKMMQMRPETLARRIMASQAVDKVNRQLGLIG